MAPKAPAQHVADLLDELNMTSLDELDIVRVAEHLNIEIRYARLDACAANIIGVGEHAIITVNQASTLGRKRYSIGHEIGHWIYDQGKGLYLCDAKDLNVPWNSRLKTSPAERRANRFAAELLMPRDWFLEAASDREMSFDTVEELREDFQTSRTSTAIRLVELGSDLAMLIMFDCRGHRKWYCASTDFPERMYPCKNISRNSRAWEDIVKSTQLASEAHEVDGDLWIDHPRAFELTLLEQAIRVGENVLVMVAVTDDQVISEIIEADEAS